MTKPLTYADAGVSIDAGNELVERIKPAVASTKRSGVMGNVGGFGALFDLKETGYKDPILVSGTDGVGTKLKIAIDSKKHSTIGIDLVAMCVNDLVVQGAEPLFFLDYFATGGLDNDVAATVVESIAEGCKQAGCALTGGETAEMPGMYAKGDYDLGGFCVGAVERDGLLPHLNDMKEGDLLIALPSSGVHSNGFSLVRKVVENADLTYQHAAPFAESISLGEALLAPTKIYVKACLDAIKVGGVKGLSHITGGGLTENLPRVLPENLGAEIKLESLQQLPVFKWLQEAGNIEQAEMLRTFNCGVGMVLIVDASQKDAILTALKPHEPNAYVLGELIVGNGCTYA